MPSIISTGSTKNVVVVGHGMVGHRFVEALRARDDAGAWRITVLAEEADAAYDRVGLTGYTEHWDRTLLALAGNDYADDELVELRLGQRVISIDRDARTVTTADGTTVGYDALVLATGSYAFVPPVPGRDLPACHVYRTFDDLDAIRADAARARDTTTCSAFAGFAGRSSPHSSAASRSSPAPSGACRTSTASNVCARSPAMGAPRHRTPSSRVRAGRTRPA